MNMLEHETVIWSINLDRKELAALAKAAGNRFVIRNWTMDNLPTEADQERDDPMLVWVAWRTWLELTGGGAPRPDLAMDKGLDSPQVVLILDGSPSSEQWEQLMNMGFFAVLTQPVSVSALTATLNRAREIHHLYQDILRMTREISLERELLARKTEHLAFINRFLTRATENLDPMAIFATAREDLSMLLPVTLLQGAVWTPNADDAMDVRLFLAQDLAEESRIQWREYLLDNASQIAGLKVAGYTIGHLPGTGEGREIQSPPLPGNVIALPLSDGQETYGCITLASDEHFHLGRDQVQILTSAVRHLGLALKNGLLYSRIKTKADYDGLTRVYNRSFFDETLRKEALRHKRYDQPLSLVILDIDHFKAVNDRYGHQVGDEVLKEVGAMLQDMVRNTDVAARYGGEEFALILPQTDSDQAWTLAERLRARLSRHTFRCGDLRLEITASFGIATLEKGVDMESAEMVRQADQALYLAKANGRNVIFFAQKDAAARNLVQ